MSLPAPTEAASRARGPAVGALATTLAGAAVVAAVLVAIHPMRLALAWRYERVLPGIVAATLLASFTHGRVRRGVQTAAVVLAFAAFHRVAFGASAPLGPVLAPALFALLVWRLPLHRPAWRAGVVFGAPTAYALAALARPPFDSVCAPETIAQLAVATHAFANRPSRSLLDCLRALYANGVAAVPVPAADLDRADVSPRSQATGAAWVCLGLGLVATHAATRRYLPDPWHALTGGDPSWPLAAAGWWAIVSSYIAGAHFVQAGTLRLLGLPVRAPMRAPWRSTNFLEYWRRMNVYNYVMLRDVYFREYWPPRGPRMAVGIVVVFLLSALFHALPTPLDGGIWLRWAIEGVLAAATALWLERRAISRVRRHLALAGTRSAAGPTPAWRRALAVPAVAAVVVAHGILMPLSYGGVARPAAGPSRTMDP